MPTIEVSSFSPDGGTTVWNFKDATARQSSGGLQVHSIKGTDLGFARNQVVTPQAFFRAVYNAYGAGNVKLAFSVPESESGFKISTDSGTTYAKLNGGIVDCYLSGNPDTLTGGSWIAQFYGLNGVGYFQLTP